MLWTITYFPSVVRALLLNLESEWSSSRLDGAPTPVSSAEEPLARISNVHVRCT